MLENVALFIGEYNTYTCLSECGARGTPALRFVIGLTDEVALLRCVNSTSPYKTHSLSLFTRHPVRSEQLRLPCILATGKIDPRAILHVYIRRHRDMQADFQ